MQSFGYSREGTNPVELFNKVNLKRFTNAELEEISKSKTCSYEFLCLVKDEIRRRLPAEQRMTAEEKRDRIAEAKFFGVQPAKKKKRR